MSYGIKWRCFGKELKRQEMIIPPRDSWGLGAAPVPQSRLIAETAAGNIRKTTPGGVWVDAYSHSCENGSIRLRFTARRPATAWAIAL